MVECWINCTKCGEPLVPLSQWAEFDEDPKIYCEECYLKMKWRND